MAPSRAGCAKLCPTDALGDLFHRTGSSTARVICLDLHAGLRGSAPTGSVQAAGRHTHTHRSGGAGGAGAAAIGPALLPPRRPCFRALPGPVASPAMAPAIDPGAAACASQRRRHMAELAVVSVPLGAGCQSGFLIWRRSRVAGVRGAGEAIGGHPLSWPCLCAPSRPVCGGQATSTRESARGPPRSPTLCGPVWPSLALSGLLWPSLAPDHDFCRQQ